VLLETKEDYREENKIIGDYPAARHPTIDSNFLPPIVLPPTLRKMNQSPNDEVQDVRF